MTALFLGHFRGDGGHELVLKGGRNGFGLAAFVDLQGLLGGVEDDPTIGTFFDVLVEFLTGLRVECRVEIVG